eukprot:5155242-Prymnesium_polylepis.1
MCAAPPVASGAGSRCGSHSAALLRGRRIVPSGEWPSSSAFGLPTQTKLLSCCRSDPLWLARTDGSTDGG